MRQRGKKVVSTKESYYNLTGKVNGSQLKGRLIGDAGLVFSFVIDISSDGQSFEGIIDDYWGTAHIKGQRKE